MPLNEREKAPRDKANHLGTSPLMEVTMMNDDAIESLVTLPCWRAFNTAKASHRNDG
jgi:hypothetical protein